MFDTDAAQVLKQPNRIITLDEHQVLIQLQNLKSLHVSGCKITLHPLQFLSSMSPTNPGFFPPGRSASQRDSRARKPRCSSTSWVRRAALSPQQMCWRRFRRAETSRLLSNTFLTSAPSARSRCPSVRSESAHIALFRTQQRSGWQVQLNSLSRFIQFQTVDGFCSFSAQTVNTDHDWTALLKGSAFKTWAICHAQRPSWPDEAFREVTHIHDDGTYTWRFKGEKKDKHAFNALILLCINKSLTQITFHCASACTNIHKSAVQDTDKVEL